jgi:periplasmic copper chaperone A
MTFFVEHSELMLIFLKIKTPSYIRMIRGARMKRLSGLLFLGLFAALILAGCGSLLAISSSGTLTVDDVWARPAMEGGTSAVYFVIENRLNRSDTLLSAETDVAAVTELHMTNMDAEGTMKMMHQENVPIPDNQRVEFRPGGLHVMLINLNEDLNEGDHFTVTLTFEQTGQLQIEAEVRAP